MIKNKQRKFISPNLAYAGYLLQSFLKRPFGYIVAILYVVYLAVILLIVPAALHFEPLFIWNVGGFNMPIFNLYFIAAMAASIAVAVFRTGRDDGTDLNLSAKPLTKGATVGIKTGIYLLIMLIVSLLTVVIVALIMPIFGKYNEVSNATGIDPNKYTSLLLSVFVGNTVNMLLFGAIAVFISMVGGQVIIMIGTIGIVFLMCLMNFIFPQVIRSATDVLSDKYDTEILSYSCNTLGQYENADLGNNQFNYATIQCITDDFYDEDYHYDTYEYWTKAARESGRQAVNYIDFGKQLSSIYSSFGLDDSKLKEASKLVIGANSAYNYHIDELTHITLEENLEARNYPISYYGIIESQGKTYPAVLLIGGDMTITTSNWYARSTIFQLDFNSLTYVSDEESGMSVNDKLRDIYGKTWNKINDLRLTYEQQNKSRELYLEARETYKDKFIVDPGSADISEIAHNTIINGGSGILFEGNYDDLSHSQKQLVMSKCLLHWTTLAQEDQNNNIQQYWQEVHHETVAYPFSSKVVKEWHDVKVDSKTEGIYKPYNQFNLDLYHDGFWIENIGEDDSSYARLVSSSMSYAETFNNLYQYHVTSFYNIASIIAVWSIIAGVLFAGSIIVYKRTDFK